MKLREALKLLKNHNYIIESEKFTDYDNNKIGKYAKLRNTNRVKKTKEKELYLDDKRNNDSEGLKWLDVQSRDYYVIGMAVLDGACDRNRFGFTNDTYNSIKSDQDFDDLCHNNPDFNELLNSKELNKFNYKAGIWPFLQEYFKQSFVKVYRGFNLTNDDIAKFINPRTAELLPNKLIPFISNETKEFNSFSVNPDIARDFATNSVNDRYNMIVIEGQADRSDINWAFTAYLMGRHGGTEECELNINNIKELKNLHIVDEWSTINTTQKSIDKASVQKVISKLFSKYNNRNSICDKLKIIYNFNRCSCYVRPDKSILMTLYGNDRKRICYFIGNEGTITGKIDITHYNILFNPPVRLSDKYYVLVDKEYNVHIVNIATDTEIYIEDFDSPDVITQFNNLDSVILVKNSYTKVQAVYRINQDDTLTQLIKPCLGISTQSYGGIKRYLASNIDDNGYTYYDAKDFSVLK